MTEDSSTGRNITIFLLKFVSFIFMLWGSVAFFTAFSVWQNSDLPWWFRIFYFFYNPACIWLGIFSWKRADCFKSTWMAFFLLIARFFTYILAFLLVYGSMIYFEKPMAASATEIEKNMGSYWALLAIIFFVATFLLTMVNAGRSAKKSDFQRSGRYVIDPRAFDTDRGYFGCLVVFWLIWALATMFFTGALLTKPDPMLSIFLIFAWFLTIAIPISLFNKDKKQILEVTGASLVIHGTQGYPKSRVQIDKQNLHALTLEHYDDTDQESVYTLNLLQKPGLRTNRIMLASFVNPKDKVVLFKEIREFLQENGFVFNVKNEMAG